MTHEPITVVICLDHASLKGGLERVAVDSAIGLKRQGHRPILFTSAGPVTPELIAADIEVVCLDQMALGGNPSRVAAAIQGLWNAPAAKALEDLLGRLPRENTIVHVHGWAGALSPAIAGPIARSGFPAIFTIHDYYQFCPNGGFYDYPHQHACKLQPLSAACWMSNCDQRSYVRKLWRNVRALLATQIAGLPTVFKDYITISNLQQEIVTPFVPKGVTLHRVSNPVSVPDLGPKPEAAAGDIIFVGRLSQEKGVLLFAEAARRIGLTATFIGEGPLAADLAARYPEARQLGWRDQATVHQAMRAARALVFPSIWYEGQPLTVLEAKGLGVPVIVSDACAGRESVEDGISGLWFKSGDIDDLARALVAMRDDAAVRAMSAAAYAGYWAHPPTIDTHVGNLTRIYRGMTGQAAVDQAAVDETRAPDEAPAAAARELAYHG